MRTPHALSGLLFATTLVLVFSLQACSKPWLQMRQVPENGYDQTLNYQFQAQVHTDSLGNCQMMVVRVRPINKIYTKGAPPARLRLFDDDCMSPLRFERVNYVSKSGQVQLHGPQVTYFMSEYVRLEDELLGWLWRQGIE